jgi:hypothetical protein
MQETKTGTLRLLAVASRPVKLLARGLHKLIPHNKRWSVLMLGVLFMLLGSYMATTPQHIVPHALWDMVAYFIHGLGGAPIIERIITLGGKL